MRIVTQSHKFTLNVQAIYLLLKTMTDRPVARATSEVCVGRWV